MLKKVSQKQLNEMIINSIKKHINESFDGDEFEDNDDLLFYAKNDDFDISQIPDQTDDDLEKNKFYDAITENTQNAMRELDSIIYILDHCDAYNFDRESNELKIVRKNVEHIFDRLRNIFEDYDLNN